ncbi:Uncharacterised protein [Candidatus Anstonella stagnisolia]|nr:Uncharacterised protein [Candidatus Anstonella stagnisolia]
MYLRIMESSEGNIVAACDRELIGRVFREGRLVLDLEKYAGFYKGEPCSSEGLSRALRGAASMNLVGERSVACALGAGIAKKENVLFIAGVPHLQVYRI